MEDRLWPRASNWIVSDRSGPAEVDMYGVPSSVASISGSEARRTPAAFRSALGGFSPFDGDRDIDFAKLTVSDHGDLAVDDTTMESSQASIDRAVASLNPEGVAVFIGGDNAVTRPIIRSLYPDLSEVGVITIDAHHDVRVLDGGPTNGTPIRGLIEDGLPGRNVAQIGIHSFANSAAYRRYCEEQGISIFTMQQIEDRGIGPVVEAALYRLAHVATVYVDFDIDVLDRAFAPGCPGARPGGMTPRQLGDAAFVLGSSNMVAAADLVEVDASADRDNLTVQAMVHTFMSFVSGVSTRKEIP